MGIGSAINTARETVHNLPTSPEAIRAGAMNMCQSAIATCKGSGSIKTELGNLASTCAMYPVNIAASALTACKEIVTLHPVDAVCTALKGATAACTDVAKIITSPIPIASATAQQGLKAAKEVVKAPVTIPLAVGRTIERGVGRVSDLFTSATTPEGASGGSKAADLGGTPITPPPSAPTAV